MTDGPPKDGTIILVQVWEHFRWLPYKPNSEQFRKGIKGRWQKMNEYGGWDNAGLPEAPEWREWK